MTSELPPEAHHYRRSQTPESPRPLHLPEPSDIPVLQNQMDPVFNDTNTYDIAPDDSSLSNIPNTSRLVHPTFDLATQMRSSLPLSEQFPKSQSRGETQSSGSSTLVLNGTTGNQAILAHTDVSSPNVTAPDLQYALDSLAKFSESAHANANPGLALAEAPFHGEAVTENLPLPAEEAIDIDAHAQADAAVRSKSPDIVSKDGLDYQVLLDTLSQPTATASSADIHSAPTIPSTHEEATLSQIGPGSSLPAGAGLPPRPPPQEKPTIHPNYSPNESLRSYHQLPPQNVHPSSYQSQPGTYRQHAAGNTASIVPPPSQPLSKAANGLPPPPVATFQQSSAIVAPLQSPSVQNGIHAPEGEVESSTQGLDIQSVEDEEEPWGQDTQKKYDSFLHDERSYVTEGVWDRFPPGSRLFVGNLPTEKVTKRDLFHIFHRHGTLAQISLKQAYGFVQFLEASSCYSALSKEQGVAIRGRKIHLEISKPQKGSRNSGPADGKSNARRRSRSPERRRIGTDRDMTLDRMPFSGFRDESSRRRDDYRPLRSPSPRELRGREDYRVRDRSPVSATRYGRPRSPVYGADGSRFRSRSPGNFDDEVALPLPRRDPRDVPDVQILILEDIDLNFSRYIEDALKQKGLRATTIHLNPRITLAAVIKRQIIEGVQAVVKLTRDTQYSNRIPLQVFDRGTGVASVNFLEYVDLDVSIAADIVIQAKQKERMSLLPTSALSPHALNHGALHQPHSYPRPSSQSYPQAFAQHYPSTLDQPMANYPAAFEPTYGGQNHQSPTGQGQSLQELLANLRQTPQNQGQREQQHLSITKNGAPDLGALLSNVARQQTQSQGFGAPQYPQQPPINHFAQSGPPQPFTNPEVMSNYTTGSGVGGGLQQAPAQNVQHIMDQLSRWRQ